MFGPCNLTGVGKSWFHIVYCFVCLFMSSVVSSLWFFFVFLSLSVFRSLTYMCISCSFSYMILLFLIISLFLSLFSYVYFLSLSRLCLLSCSFLLWFLLFLIIACSFLCFPTCSSFLFPVYVPRLFLFLILSQSFLLLMVSFSLVSISLNVFLSLWPPFCQWFMSWGFWCMSKV